MNKKQKDVESILVEALRQSSIEERRAYLEATCGSDIQLRAEIESLLLAYEDKASLLKVPPDLLEGSPFDPNVTLDDSPLSEGPGTIIGRYKLLERIGEGGMAVVYMAEQKKPLRRTVALKIIKLGMDTKSVITRFEVERQALAMMEHPNIAKVLDAGKTETGRPYFVMELVKGVSITDYCDKNKLSTRERLELFISICNAVQHAHQKGIIHRDIKPSNVMVTLRDGKPVPKVIDFGIAKATSQRLTEKTLFTRYAQMIGTPAYMSPEQAEFSELDIDTRTDIYSLGVLLYELLTGATPFSEEQLREAGYLEMQRIIREEEPLKPSTKLSTLGDTLTDVAEHRKASPVSLQKLIRGDLDWIVMKSLEKDRARRYKAAAELVVDIARHLNHEPVLAAAPSLSYKAHKFIRRHRVGVTAGLLVAAVIALGLVVSIWQATVATNARNEALRAKAEKDLQAQIAVKERDNALVAQQQAEEQRQRAEASEQEARRLLYAANMNLAQHAWEQNNVGRMRQLLEETASYPQRGFEWYYWQKQAHPEVRTLRGHTEGVWSVAFSPDGRRIATGGCDGPVKVWDAASGKELLTLGDYNIDFLAFSPYMEELPWTGNTGAVAFSPDGQRIVTSSWHGTAKVWEADSGKELLTLRRHELAVSSIAFSPDGQRIVTGSYDSTAKVWEANSGKELLSLPAHDNVVCSVAFSPDGRRIITSSTLAKVWEAASGRELFALNGHSEMVWSACFSQDGQRIVTGSSDGAKVWEANTGKELTTLRQETTDAVVSVAFSPDGQRIVTTGYMTAKVWETDSGKELFTLKGHSDLIRSAAFSPDGRWIITGSQNGTAKIWEATSGRERILRGHSHIIESVAFSPDSQRIVTGSDDGTAKVWDATSGKELLNLKGHDGQVISVAFSPDGQRIVTGGEDGMAKVWEATSGKDLLTLKGHSSQVLSVVFFPDGQRIVTGSDDGTAKVWDATSGKELLNLKGHDGQVISVAFSPDGQQVVTVGEDRTPKVLEAASGEALLTLKGHNSQVLSVVFSPDGRRIATGSYDCTARIWEAASGRELLTLKGHGAPIVSVAFSPDGQRLVTSSLDKTAKVWEATSGKELLTLQGHNYIQSVAFSPDGQRIVTGSLDGTAQVWEVASLEQVAAWQQEERDAARRLVALQREQAAAVERYKALRAQDPGAIKKWLVLAPLAFDGQDDVAVLAALDQTQLPQEAALRPRAGERVKVGEIEQSWKVTQQEDNLIDFNRILGKTTNYSLAYAVCYIDSEGEQADLLMRIGSGDVLKVYLNGREIHRREESLQHYVWTTAEVTGVQLKAGRNVLVLKVVNQINDWRASIRLTDVASQPVKGIRVTLEPPEEAQP